MVSEYVLLASGEVKKLEASDYSNKNIIKFLNNGDLRNIDYIQNLHRNNFIK